MTSVQALVFIAVGAWVTQIALGWIQIQKFNRALATLSQQGQLCIGRSAGRFQPRVVVAISLNEAGYITDSFMMKGLTVFARPEAIPVLSGKRVEELDPLQLFPKNKSIQQAMMLAMANKG